MEWFHHRISAAAHLQRSWTLLAAIALLFLSITGDTILAFIRKEVGVIFGASLWAWSLMIGLFFLTWWLFENFARLRDQLTPKVTPDFKEDEGGVVLTPEDRVDLSTGKTLESSAAAYIRARVECTSALGPKACAAFLTRIERKDKGTGPELMAVAKLYDSVQLPWSLIGVCDIPIHPGIPKHVDIAMASSKENKLAFCGAIPFTVRGFTDEHATYLADVSIIADGIPSDKITVEIHWNGKWDEITARKV